MPTQTFRRLAWATAIATYALMVLGGATKAYGAGLSCPDWPLCYGKLIPTFNSLILLEWGHRLGVLLVSALALITTITAFRIPSQRGPWVRGCLLALGILPVQAVLGGLTVITKLHPAIDAAHLATGTAFLSVWVAVAVSASLSERAGTVVGPRLTLVPMVAALAAYSTMIVGSFMKSSDAGLACPDWPLCQGQLIPAGAGYLAYLQFGHRVAALTAVVLVLYTAFYMVRRASRVPTLVYPAVVAAGLVFIQALLGGVAVTQSLPPAITVTHLAVAAALIATLVALTTASYRLSAAGVLAGEAGRLAGVARLGQRPGAVLAAYVQLMKPRIILLLLITCYAAMWVANGDAPSAGLALITLLGLTLTSGGANAVNMWWDRDIDAVMSRTKKRPIPSGRLEPEQALIFGMLACVVGVALLAVAVNLLSAVLALAGFLYYVVIYTMWLKRTSTQNIVIGGAAGAVPPLVGWAAVTGNVGVEAMLMFLVVFLWTPPHFWALALFRNEDYRRAGVPMLPVVRGESYTKWQILLYALLMVPTSMLLYWTGVVGSNYLLAAWMMGIWFVSGCVFLLRERVPSHSWAPRVFGGSIVYLAILFLAMVLDVRP